MSASKIPGTLDPARYVFAVDTAPTSSGYGWETTVGEILADNVDDPEILGALTRLERDGRAVLVGFVGHAVDLALMAPDLAEGPINALCGGDHRNHWRAGAPARRGDLASLDWIDGWPTCAECPGDDPA